MKLNGDLILVEGEDLSLTRDNGLCSESYYRLTRKGVHSLYCFSIEAELNLAWLSLLAMPSHYC